MRCPTCGSVLRKEGRCGACGAELPEDDGSVPDPVLVVEHGGTRYLVNLTDFAIRSLTYDTWCDYNVWEERVTHRTTVGRFRVTDVPARSHVPIEQIDPMEDGVIFFGLVELEWEEGTVARNILLRRQKLWDGGTVPGTLCAREKEKVGVVRQAESFSWGEGDD